MAEKRIQTKGKKAQVLTARQPISKKSKEPETSDSDEESEFEIDAEEIPIRRKLPSSKIARVPEVPTDNISFHHPDNANRWKYVCLKRIALERELNNDALECKDIMDLIKNAGLMKTVIKFNKCYENLVKEFIVNLSDECADGRSADFESVFVRGRRVKFSPSEINKFLGRTNKDCPDVEATDNEVCQTITARQVKCWPLKGKLNASKLSMKFAILHKIGAANWVPTNHKSTISTGLGRFIYAVGTKTEFDYGRYIFDQTLKHAGSYAIKGPIAFPSLLCGIVLAQYPDILVERDTVCKRAPALGLHYKLFHGSHVPDIVMTSAETSTVKTQSKKSDVIAVLKETCKELDTRKRTLENLIARLEQEETEGNRREEGVEAEGHLNTEETSSSESDDSA